MVEQTGAERTGGTESLPLVQPSHRIRLWPAGLLIALYWGIRVGDRVGFLPRFLNKSTTSVAIMTASGLLVWWLFFSRLRWPARFLGLFVLVVGGAAAIPLVHESLKSPLRGGVVLFAAPFVVMAALAWLLVARRASTKVRTAGLSAVVLAAWASFLLLRVVDGSGDLKWRWSPTAEQKYLAERTVSPPAPVSAIGPLVVGPSDWPQFRGPQRDNRVAGLRIETDWVKHPPKLMWKHRIGPAWSSFSVVDHVCFTQEQRGDDEATVCYHLDTGDEVWSRADAARFWTAQSGAGPRATPTFQDAQVYAMGATGLLNCIDAATGQLVWQRNLTKDAGVDVPDWGFAASPLVGDDKVIVFAGGGNGKGTVAYHTADGEVAWFGGSGSHSFSSAQLARINGVEQILMAHDLGLDALAPDDGKTLWHHDWNMDGYARMVQPHVFGDDSVILASGYGNGSRMLKVSHGDDAWRAETVWTSKKLIPYYNDFVVYEDHAYGFDGNIFCCIDLKTGERRWKKGRYGNGQVLLLVEQGILLVLADDGTAILVAAEPAELREVSRFKALTGTTWNHPVVVRDKLLVRNAEEAACYELTSQ